jgi:hypothetical protein
VTRTDSAGTVAGVSGSSWGRVLDTVRLDNRTVPASRSVLVVVHTVTALNRFADVLDVFEADRRLQLYATCPGAAHVPADLDRALADTGALTISWAAATSTSFNLAISAHHSGNLHDIDAPLILLSHGMGYTKARKSGNPEIRKSGESVYGLGPEWLLRDGRVFADAIVLSHNEQLARLADATPAAVDRALVAGDPCFDRMLASVGKRAEYRHALGADDDQTIVVVSSTWGETSLFGTFPDLLSDLVAELPLDHTVAAVLHPNVWYAHGPAQVRRWLGDALRAGLRLVPPLRGWQQAVLAADVVLGDHGAVTGYAAACGIPTVLVTFPAAEVPTGSAIDALGRTAPRLDQHRPTVDQLHPGPPDPVVAELTSSVPGGSAEALRALCYRLLDLPEPDRPPLVVPYPAAHLTPEHHEVTAFWAATEWTGDAVRVTTWPADVPARPGRGPRATEAVLIVSADHPRRDLRGSAAIVLTTRDPAAVLRDHPACQLVAHTGPNGCRIHDRTGISATVTPGTPAVLAAIHDRIVHSGHLPESLTVLDGPRRTTVTIDH